MSGSPVRWRWFLQAFARSALGFGGALYAFILVADPYQNVPFSPDWPRVPIDTNQRFSYPAIARNVAFDSAVIGTSTARLLNPDHLNVLLRARFANLAMNSATAWEQAQITKLFLRHHRHAKYLVLGIDTVWCGTGEHYEKLTFRLFPQWMYDENRWNDLFYLFNDKALEQAVREVEYLRGKRPPKYRPDGYDDFLPPDAEYDLAKARRKIYGTANPDRSAMPAVEAADPTLRTPELRFPTHELLAEVLAAAPASTIKVLLFVPYHEQARRAQGAQYGECKGRIVDIAARHPNTHVVDFMIDTPITTDDSNYWDVLHYRRAIARTVEHSIATAITERVDVPGAYRYLKPERVIRAPGRS